MARVLWTESPPADAEIHCDGHLIIHRYDDSRDRPCVKAWRKKSQKPFACHWFRSVSDRASWVEGQIEATERRRKMMRDQAARRKQDAAEMRERIQVGTLLANCWGYSMTIVDFYQVVAKRGAMVDIRKIAGKVVSGDPTCGRVSPDRDHFVGPPMRKRITAYGVSMDCGSASPTTDEATHGFNTWD